MKKITGAQAIIHFLLQEGVDIVFGYPGGAIMPTYDAMYIEQNKLNHILVRHEQGAVHAAVGYARTKGQVGVCLATSGPGATNLITGITDAMLDSVPLVCITGQVTSSLLGTDAFQEADIIGMTIPVTKWNYQITEAAQIPTALAKAFYIARTGRQGPVLLDITKDAQTGLLDYEYPSYAANKQYNAASEQNNLEDIQAAANLINQAKKPYLLIGQGVLKSGAMQEVLQLAERADIPVASTLLGLSAFPSNHPLYAGMLGMHGNYAANVLTNKADILIAIGMRFDDRVTGNLSRYAKQAKIIHIDIDRGELGKNVSVDIAFRSDAKKTIEKLLPFIHLNRHKTWRKQFNDYYQLEYKKVIAKEIFPQQGPLKMAEVIHHLSSLTNDKTIVVTDVGQHQMIAARYFRFTQPNTHITSGGLGTMGFALPAAIGAALAEPETTVIAIAGDGGFQMNIQELGVIAQENLPIKILILNNQRLGMVRQWQELFFDKHYSFTTLKNPDFVTIANGYGIAAQRVSERQELKSALKNLLEHPSAFLLEIIVDTQENVFPMIAAGAGVDEVRLE